MTRERCEHCGAELAGQGSGGVCPRCALELALDVDETLPAGSGRPEPEVPSDARRVTIERFDLIEKIGEGGMGEVWLARQLAPVRRQVAVKILKLGMDSRDLIARFEGERQALAMMDHPAVAKVFDAGVTSDGRPFVAMEHVRGEPITAYCDRHALAPADRLALFRKVCEGVHHAHQKAIIHRDLKPSNILVAADGGEPTPKIIDFGIAKAVDRKLTERTLFTELGVLVGTPEYMSPEQASGTGDRVDTRTDVYSLGVVLYELMAGALPFDSSSLRAEGYEGLRRVIREVEPPRPSTRVETLGGRAAKLAGHRRTDPRALSRQLRGDLDWITMKALDKEPARRYASCAELAADIGRFLSCEPVSAGPPSVAYRARKFVRRHRMPVAAALALLTVLIGGLAATTTFWAIARAERQQVLRLADLKLVRDSTEDAEALWPALPRNVDALATWLRDKGEPLAARLPEHRATLAALRARAHPYDEEQRRHDVESHPRSDELRDAREAADEIENETLVRVRERYFEPDRDEVIAHYEFRLRQARDLIDELERKVSERRTWRFDDEETQWQHEMLTDLVERLTVFADPDPFVGAVGSVRSRLAFARSIEERSVSGPRVAEAWREARAAIREAPLYGELELAPQVGLVPLGPDPRSGLWEFWHVGSGARPLPHPDASAPNRWLVDAETGIVLVLVPGGTFAMGAQAGDPDAPNFDPDATRRERPVMDVTLAPFFVARYEMTQAQWRRLSGSNPSRFDPVGEYGDEEITLANPVEMITWFAADRLLRRHDLALPTEAQWEYAARAGTETPWWTGTRAASVEGAANLQDRALLEAGGNPDWRYERWLDDEYEAHAPVGTYRPNPFGLHEVIGNVAEWTRDYYRTPYRSDVAPGDGYRHVPGGTASRVARGGGYRDVALGARSASRFNQQPETPSANIGVRPARPVD